MLGWCVTQPGLFCSISQDHLVLDYVAFIFFLIFLGTLMDFWFKETCFPFHFQQIFLHNSFRQHSWVLGSNVHTLRKTEVCQLKKYVGCTSYLDVFTWVLCVPFSFRREQVQYRYMEITLHRNSAVSSNGPCFVPIVLFLECQLDNYSYNLSCSIG